MHPPLFYTMTPHGKTLPTTTKILTGVIALVGLACGLLLWSQLYTFPNPYAP